MIGSFRSPEVGLHDSRHAISKDKTKGKYAVEVAREAIEQPHAALTWDPAAPRDVIDRLPQMADELDRISSA
jgi:hypothetical protein